ncbi:hypothetical protein ACEUCJ_07585 [Aeromonas rivipollensis]
MAVDLRSNSASYGPWVGRALMQMCQCHSRDSLASYTVLCLE